MLEKDPLLTRILSEKSKDSGYNTLEGILDEDTVQALDQIIQERLGFGQDAATRWTTRDQGMHVLAAGLLRLAQGRRLRSQRRQHRSLDGGCSQRRQAITAHLACGRSDGVGATRRTAVGHAHVRVTARPLLRGGDGPRQRAR